MGLRIRCRGSATSTLVVVLGLLTGAATAAAWSSASAAPASVEPKPVFDATHVPPLLTAAGEAIDLDYDVHCASSEAESADAGCSIRGAVFVRGVGDREFVPLPLEQRTVAGRRAFAARVPDGLRTSRGIEYYAVVEAPELGERLLVPAGGAAAPHVSRPLGTSIEVRLGRHDFGRARRRSSRAAFARWGDGAGEAGLEPGRPVGPIGASAFDVDPDGNVLVLDHVHRRLLRWTGGSAAPTSIPVSVNGTLADMTVAGDGSIYVLETTAPPGRNPLVRRFDDGGRELEAVESAERTPSQIRMDARGPVVLGRPSHHWMPVLVDGVPAPPVSQVQRGRPGRRFPDGKEVVALRHGDEVRIALVAGRTVTQSWRVTSETSLAEVQLAEPSGQRVVVVVRAYDDTHDEFIVLVLGRSGLLERFAVDPADWAEAAPLGRFRLVGRSLYRLGSSVAGVFVDRFDLEARS